MSNARFMYVGPVRIVSLVREHARPANEQVMQSLTRHRHAFIRDVRLTEAEWQAATRRRGSISGPAAHLHFLVAAEGLRTLVTHIFVGDDSQLEIGDSVFGVKDSLIKRFVRQPASAPAPEGRDLGDCPWARVRFDVILATGQDR